MPGVNCDEFEDALMEMARDGVGGHAVRRHLDECRSCNAALDRQRRLTTACGVLARESMALSAPPRVERVLTEMLNDRHRVQRRRWGYVFAGGAIAASLAVAWLLAPRPVARPEVPRDTARLAPTNTEVGQTSPAIAPARRRPRKAVKPPVDDEPPFVAIPYTLPLDPWERTDLVHAEMPVGQLVAAGFSVGMVDPGARVQADVLVGQDGRARAIRLVSLSVPVYSGLSKEQ